MRLLEAMHRGCSIRLDDRDGLRWHVEARIVIPMRLYDEDEITLVDLDSDEMLSGTAVGERQHMPDWPIDQPYLRLGAGILLIRTALAVRKGIALNLTPSGRALAAARLGPGVDVAGRPVLLDDFAPIPLVRISDQPIEMTAFAAVPADQRITVLPSPDRRSATLRFDAGEHRLEAAIATTDAERAFASLDQATEQQTRCFVDLSDTTRLLKGGRKSDRIEVDVLQDFERAIVALQGADVPTFVTAIRRAIEDDVTTVMQPVAVAYGRFDAVISDLEA